MATIRRGKPQPQKKLTTKQESFVREYLIDLNASKAAERAGYSPKVARKQGCLNLQNPLVAAAVQREIHAQQKRTLITADQVLMDIQRIGDKAEKAEDWAQALKSRELLGKRHKLFADKVEHTGPNGGPVQFERIVREVVDPKA